MLTESTNVSAEFQEFAAEQVKSGRYATAREVFDAVKLALAREKSYQERLAYLRQAIQEGMDSGIAEGDVFARARARAGLPPRASAS
jgi:putative addiction module CopG family antidote